MHMIFCSRPHLVWKEIPRLSDAMPSKYSALVIGANGYIGRPLVRQLLLEGRSVTGIASSKSPIKHDRYRHIIKRIDAPFLLDHYDVIYFMAGVGYCYDQLSVPDLVRQHIHLLQSTLKSIRFPHHTVFVLPSSASVYGATSLRCVSESHHLYPVNVLGRVKRCAEFILGRFADKVDMKTLVVRIFNVYGGADHASFIAKVKHSMKEGVPLSLAPDAVRDFVHIDDVAAALSFLSNSTAGIFNVGTGLPIRLGDLVHSIQRRSNRLLHVIPHAVSIEQMVADNRKLLNAGFQFAHHGESCLLDHCLQLADIA